MKWWIGVVSFCLVGSVMSQEELSPQEVFFLRRQAEFWKDRDYALMKMQIVEFLKMHPSSHIHNNLFAMLGDLLYQEEKYAEALHQYRLITDAELREKTRTRRVQCLYLEGDYDAVLSEVKEKVELSEELRFILADSMFRKLRLAPDPILAAAAKPLLLTLQETSYKDKVVLPLAEVHRMLGEVEEAASLYMKLGAGNQEEFLLQAASLQLEFDSLLALTTLQRIVNLKGAKASDAAYHEYVLLFQQDRFAELIERSHVLEPLLSEERTHQFSFCLGRSYFKTGAFIEAVSPLVQFVHHETDPSPHKRAAFLMLIQCAKETDHRSLFNETLSSFQAVFPRDEEVGKALLLRAQLFLQQGNLKQASLDLNQLLSDFPDFPDQETLLYDQAVLLYQTEEWEQSRLAFTTYLEKFPSTPLASVIWSSIVHCSIQELKQGTRPKELLVLDLERALSLEPNASYQFLLGQLLFDLKRWPEAASLFTSFCTTHPDHSDALFLHALSLKESASDPLLFTTTAEQALTHTLSSEQKSSLHLHLFNAYLSLCNYSQAADHLYEAWMTHHCPIQEENQLWLAHHYLQTSPDRAKTVFKAVLKLDDTYTPHFDPARSHLEREALLFASLLTPSEKLQLLSSLRHPDALLERAKTLTLLNRPNDALTTLDALLSQNIPSPLFSAALLEKTRLLSTDPNSLDFVLSTLKDLQIQKELASEPTHLEAALDYVDVRIRLAQPETRTESALFFLNRIKTDFSRTDDPASQKYHEERLRFPEKDRLFQLYMQCLEAEILSWESQEAHLNSDPEKAQHNHNVASQLFQSLLQDPLTTPYLKHRAEAQSKLL